MITKTILEKNRICILWDGRWKKIAFTCCEGDQVFSGLCFVVFFDSIFIGFVRNYFENAIMKINVRYLVVHSRLVLNYSFWSLFKIILIGIRCFTLLNLRHRLDLVATLCYRHRDPNLSELPWSMTFKVHLIILILVILCVRTISV